ncbi:MAG: SDR family NAD(P)-dependent oxidoreductase [Cyanobacteria bacterium P01_E01_bin.42]
MSATYTGLEIAVIGLSGRFPGSNTIEDFWKNLADGVELISTFDDSPSDSQPIRAGSVLEGVDRFDADFFGFNPREAQMMDPQHRLFLECAWEALENSGYSSPTEKRSIGIFAGVGMGTYLLYNLSPTPGLLESQGFLSTVVGVDKDYLPTRVSYKLNLKGPSMSVGTACSSSLTAVHLACQSLLGGECDIALGAGVAVKVPQSSLTLAPDEIVSNDGHCRAFDRDATGTVGGNGIGVVVLKRLEDAMADNDTIYAVIKGSAVNNDGGRKIGYTAPSEEGQTRVIRTAQMMAEVEPDSIGYMEAHGTGTPLGDPIEIAAMTKAFREKCDAKGFCATGSVKTNVGHLDAAAGITGFMKTVLALHHQQIPPSLNFNTPNPQIDFENSPFYVNTQLKDWQRNGTPRRAGVSSFGFGGTNVHVVLEEAPSPSIKTSANRPQLLSLSAKTATALERMSDRLVNHLKASPDLDLADVAGTLHLGRWQLPHRRTFVAQTVAEAIAILEAGETETREAAVNEPPVILMFPGQGSQYVNMGRKLYEREAKFREVCDRCFARLKSQHDLDLASILFPASEADIPALKEKLTQTAIAQPALFVIEYALAQLWISWGIVPQAAIGHSIGEYVAACIAGVFSLEDALDLVTARGRLMQQQPSGSMVTVHLSAEKVRPFLHDSLCIGASNGPSLTVISGTAADIEQLQSKLDSQGIDYIPLHVSHAFHSPLMEGAIAPLLEQLQRVKLNSPQIPFIANVTGTWITDEQAMDPQYWGRQLRQSVEFSAGIGELLQNSEGIFLETGPGRTLSTLTRQQAKGQTILCTLPHPKDPVDDEAFLLHTAGRLWLEGVAMDWSSFYGDRSHRRIPLPTYPFDRQRYWIDPPESKDSTLEKNPELADWFYVPAWKRSVLPAIATDSPQGSWVIFSDSSGLGTALGQRLQQMGHRVVWVTPGAVYGQTSEDVYTLDPSDREHYQALIRDVKSLDSSLTFAHLWTVTPDLSLEEASRSGFYSLLYLAQALEQISGDRRDRLCVISSQVEEVTGRETFCPEKATIVGPCRVIPQEYANIACDRIDIDLADFQGTGAPQFLDRLVTEMLAQGEKSGASATIAYRGNYRWELTYDSLSLEASDRSAFRTGGTYLITGGTGGIGLEIAAFLAEKVQANLILVSRSTFPDRQDWDDWLAKAEDSSPQAAKIRKLQAIEASGGKVLVASGDVCDGEEMQAICDRARAVFGEIHGVFHAAGIPGDGIISLKTREIAEKVMAPKLEGTRVLDRIFSDTPLDFLVLFSSISALVGGVGQADYCAANAYLDAFARERAGKGVIAIDWDTWQEVGMSVDTTDLPEHLKARRLEAIEAGIAPKEGLEALDRILQRGLDRVVVSTKALQEVLAERHDLSTMAQGVETEASPTPQPEHQRRIQSTAYVAPRNEIEEWIVQLWQEQIGFSPIGVNDNFFELGGHSLLAVRVMTKLREHYAVDLSLRVLLSEAPTAAGLAASVAEQLAPEDESNSEDATETARLLAEIENLSLDEVQEQLQQETTPL